MCFRTCILISLVYISASCSGYAGVDLEAPSEPTPFHGSWVSVDSLYKLEVYDMFVGYWSCYIGYEETWISVNGFKINETQDVLSLSRVYPGESDSTGHVARVTLESNAAVLVDVLYDIIPSSSDTSPYNGSPAPLNSFVPAIQGMRFTKVGE